MSDTGKIKKNIIFKESPNDWIAYGDRCSGAIAYDRSLKKAFAGSGYYNSVSSITRGIRDSTAMSFLKKDESETLVEYIQIAQVIRNFKISKMIKDKNPLLKRDSDELFLAKLALHLTSFPLTGKKSEKLDYNAWRGFVKVFFLTGKPYHEEVICLFFKAQFKGRGGQGVIEFGKMITKIESSIKSPNEEEQFFLDCLVTATEESKEVPKQKAVHDLWQDNILRNSYDTFRSIRDRLGFSWLPTSK